MWLNLYLLDKYLCFRLSAQMNPPVTESRDSPVSINRMDASGSCVGDRTDQQTAPGREYRAHGTDLDLLIPESERIK